MEIFEVLYKLVFHHKSLAQKTELWLSIKAFFTWVVLYERHASRVSKQLSGLAELCSTEFWKA